MRLHDVVLQHKSILTFVNQETLSVTNKSTLPSTVSLESHGRPAGQETPLLNGT